MNILKFLTIIIIVFGFEVQQLQSQEIHQHALWDELLQEHVDENGMVNYKAFAENENQLDTYLQELGKYPPQNSWSKSQKKAYLINAYNAFTVKLILEDYPVESIRSIGGLFSNPFTKAFAQIGDKSYSLDDIEKGMLLKLGDPRVHFAVNCASESCPKLANYAYVATKLNQQLDKATKAFINSKENKLTPSKVELSKIFKWYASDFGTDTNSVLKFINRYADEKVNENASISYLPYSWKLNEK
jgi:hypothetical protein